MNNSVIPLTGGDLIYFIPLSKSINLKTLIGKEIRSL